MTSVRQRSQQLLPPVRFPKYRSAARPLRAAVSLLLVFVLVAGGAPFVRQRATAPVAAAVVVEAVARVPGDDLHRQGGRECIAAVFASAPNARPIARWLDLRCGGLPAARAPDAA